MPFVELSFLSWKLTVSLPVRMKGHNSSLLLAFVIHARREREAIHHSANDISFRFIGVDSQEARRFGWDNAKNFIRWLCGFIADPMCDVCSVAACVGMFFVLSHDLIFLLILVLGGIHLKMNDRFLIILLTILEISHDPMQWRIRFTSRIRFSSREASLAASKLG